MNLSKLKSFFSRKPKEKVSSRFPITLEVTKDIINKSCTLSSTNCIGYNLLKDAGIPVIGWETNWGYIKAKNRKKDQIIYSSKNCMVAKVGDKITFTLV